MRKPGKLVLLLLTAVAAGALAWGAVTAAQRGAAPRITADLVAGGSQQVALHGKRVSADTWSTRTEIAALPCAGPLLLTIVTRFFGAEPNHRAVYRIDGGAPRVLSGHARCGQPIPARYGDSLATVTMKRRRPGKPGDFRMTGRRVSHDGPFDMRLQFSTLACAGRYLLRIHMDGPREPLRILYRARVGAPTIDGETRKCDR